MVLRPSALIYCKQTRNRGRGVFALRSIPEGMTIEEAPLLVLPVNEAWTSTDDNCLSKYVFHWSDGYVALALGFGSLYNHSYDPNARCVDIAPRTKRFIALRDIAPDEEITFNYGGDPDATDDVGFTVCDTVVNHSVQSRQ